MKNIKNLLKLSLAMGFGILTSHASTGIIKEDVGASAVDISSKEDYGEKRTEAISRIRSNLKDFRELNHKSKKTAAEWQRQEDALQYLRSKAGSDILRHNISISEISGTENYRTEISYVIERSEQSYKDTNKAILRLKTELDAFRSSKDLAMVDRFSKYLEFTESLIKNNEVQLQGWKSVAADRWLYGNPKSDEALDEYCVKVGNDKKFAIFTFAKDPLIGYELVFSRTFPQIIELKYHLYNVEIPPEKEVGKMLSWGDSKTELKQLFDNFRNIDKNSRVINFGCIKQFSGDCTDIDVSNLLYGTEDLPFTHDELYKIFKDIKDGKLVYRSGIDDIVKASKSLIYGNPGPRSELGEYCVKLGNGKLPLPKFCQYISSNDHMLGYEFVFGKKFPEIQKFKYVFHAPSASIRKHIIKILSGPNDEWAMKVLFENLRNIGGESDVINFKCLEKFRDRYSEVVISDSLLGTTNSLFSHNELYKLFASIKNGKLICYSDEEDRIKHEILQKYNNPQVGEPLDEYCIELGKGKSIRKDCVYTFVNNPNLGYKFDFDQAIISKIQFLIDLRTGKLNSEYRNIKTLCIADAPNLKLLGSNLKNIGKNRNVINVRCIEQFKDDDSEIGKSEMTYKELYDVFQDIKSGKLAYWSEDKILTLSSIKVPLVPKILLVAKNTPKQEGPQLTERPNTKKSNQPILGRASNKVPLVPKISLVAKNPPKQEGPQLTERPNAKKPNQPILGRASNKVPLVPKITLVAKNTPKQEGPQLVAHPNTEKPNQPILVPVSK